MKVARFRSAISGRWVSRLFAKKHPETTVAERPRVTGQWSKPLGEVTANSNTDVIYIHGEPPAPQCQYCGHEVTWDALECPNCHAIFDEGESGVPA